MVDILCAVLSGGKWGPTVDGFTTNKLQAAFAGSADGDAAVEGGGGSSKVRAADEEEESTGIGCVRYPQGMACATQTLSLTLSADDARCRHFFGAMRIDGFRAPSAFKATIDDWISTFRDCPRVTAGRPVLIPGDPEWDAMDKRGAQGVPVKMAVIADLVDISEKTGVSLPFEGTVDISGIRRVKATTNLSTVEKETLHGKKR